MNIEKFSEKGRTLFVQFKCERCGTTALRTFEACLKDAKHGCGALWDFCPPEKWRDGGFYYPLFCPDCSKAYEEFMRNER